MSTQRSCILCAGADEDERFDYCRACGRTRSNPVEYGASSPSEASAGTPATDDHKYSIPPSPLPEGQDLAELKREIAQLIDPDAWRIGDQYPDRPKLRQYCRERSLSKADAILALSDILRLLSELETARGERDEARTLIKAWADIQADFDDFDGDRRGIAHALREAEVKLAAIVGVMLESDDD